MTERQKTSLDLAEEKISTARAIIRKRAPYLVPTIYAFIPHVMEGINTMGVTKGMVLYVDAEWILKQTAEHVAGALVHEAMHHVRNHLQRMEHMTDRDIGNIAMDLAINPDLIAAGWTLPHGVFPADYGLPENLLGEEYYNLLMQPKPPQQGGGGSGPPQPQPPGGKQKGGGQGTKGVGGGGKPDQPGGQAKGAGGTAQKPPGASPQRQPGGGAGSNPQPGGQGQGQGAGQQPGQGQHPNPGGGGQGDGSVLPNGKSKGCASGRCGGLAGNTPTEMELELDEQMGRSTAERKAIAKQTLQTIKEHVKAQGRGSVPQQLLQELDKPEEKSKIRWQDELSHVLKKASGRIEAGGMDFSLARPSKRSPSRGFPRPGLVQYQPEVAFVLDTSGSMGEAQLRSAVQQMISIFKSLGIDQAWLVQADAAVAAKPKKIRVRDLMKSLQISGRGGTNFDPALRAVEKLKPRPDLLVYLTDGDGHVTYRPKGVEVVWCIVPSGWGRKVDVNWGHVILIGDDGKKKVA